jgi:hypothetical protein
MITSLTASVATAAHTASLLGGVSIIFKVPADNLTTKTASIIVAAVAKRVMPSGNVYASLLLVHNITAVREAGLVIENRFRTTVGAGAVTVPNSTIALAQIRAVKRHSVLADSATSAQRFVREIDFIWGAFIRQDDFASCTLEHARGSFRAFKKDGTEAHVRKIFL